MPAAATDVTPRGERLAWRRWVPLALLWTSYDQQTRRSQEARLFAELNVSLADAAIKLEQLWNDLARQHAFFLRCAYPITSFRHTAHAAPFLNICSEHSAVIPG